MSEKTAEEKLREELEGSILSGGSERRDTNTKPVKKRSISQRRSARPESVGLRVDSFIDDFQKRVEESLNAGNLRQGQSSSASSHVRPRVSRKTTDDSSDVKTRSRTDSTSRKVQPVSSRRKTNEEPVKKPVRKSEPKPEIKPEVSLRSPDPEPAKPIVQEIITQPEPKPEPIETIIPDVIDAEIVEDVQPVTDRVSEPEVPEVVEPLQEVQPVNEAVDVPSEPEPIETAEELQPITEAIDAAQEVQELMPATEHEYTEDIETEAIITPEVPEAVQDVQPVNEAVNVPSEPEPIEPTEELQPITEAIDTAQEVQEVMPVTEPEHTEELENEPIITPEVPEVVEPVQDVQPVNEAVNVPSEPEPIEPTEELQPITEAIDAAQEVQEVMPVTEPEHTEELETEAIITPEVPETSDTPQELDSTPETLPEEPQQELITETEQPSSEEPEQSEILPEIPLIEPEEPEALPDIPVIMPDENDDDQEVTDDEIDELSQDLPFVDVVPEEESELEGSGMPEMFEAESVISSDEPDDAEDVYPAGFIDEPIDEQPAEPESEPESEEDIDSILEAYPEDFSPTADVVVNVDDDIPSITGDNDEPDYNPEAEASPVTVTMPETTKTAEDKLMADIAEAMTGNPLTLESSEGTEPYRLPADFFQSAANADTSQQSAEEKLIANIAEAMSESPLGAAQNNLRQDIERDLNPFDEISMSIPGAPVNVPELPEEPEEEAFLPDFAEPDETEQNENEEEHQEPFMPEPESEPESLLEEPKEPEESLQSDEDYEPFEVNEPESESLIEDNDSENDLDDDFSGLPVSFGDDDEPEPEPEPVSEPQTEQQRLEQEIAELSLTNDFGLDENAGIVSDSNINIPEEEALKQDNMPEQSLLNDNDTNLDDEPGDDWDISSLGALSEATTIPDDEPEDIQPAPDPDIQEYPTPAAVLTSRNDEEEDKEKTMGIREKLAARKNNASTSSAASKKASSSSSGGGIMTPLLLGLLLIVGVLTLLQLYQLNDRITSLMMNGGTSFESVSGYESQAPAAYDYVIDFILDPNIVERMAQRGREGWQVVGSRRTQDSTTGQYGYEFVFMRRLPNR